MKYQTQQKQKFKQSLGKAYFHKNETIKNLFRSAKGCLWAPLKTRHFPMQVSKFLTLLDQRRQVLLRLSGASTQL